MLFLLAAIILFAVGPAITLPIFGIIFLTIIALLAVSLRFAIKSLKVKRGVPNILLVIVNSVFLTFLVYGFIKVSIDVFGSDAPVTDAPDTSETSRAKAFLIPSNELPDEFANMAKRESETFLESVMKENAGLVKSKSGLIYEILKPGDAGRSSDKNDVFIMDWEMLSRSGKPAQTLDGAETAKMRREFTPDEMMPGMAEGVQLIGTGGSILLYIPSHLIYKPDQSDFPQVHKEIIMLVDLIEIKQVKK